MPCLVNKIFCHFYPQEAIIHDAKKAGKYDLGIKTVEGKQVKFDGLPRAFRFRGINAVDETIYLYKIKIDLGIDVVSAKILYLDAIKDEESHATKGNGYSTHVENDGWISSQKVQIKQGFYIDDRYEVTPKVFLYTNLSKETNSVQENKMMQIRPNLGPGAKFVRGEYIHQRNYHTNSYNMFA